MYSINNINKKDVLEMVFLYSKMKIKYNKTKFVPVLRITILSLLLILRFSGGVVNPYIIHSVEGLIAVTLLTL